MKKALFLLSLLCALLLTAYAAPAPSAPPPATSAPEPTASEPAAGVIPLELPPQQGILYAAGSPSPRYDLTAEELDALWAMLTGLSPEPLDPAEAPSGESAYSLLLCMGRFSGDPARGELPAAFQLLEAQGGAPGVQSDWAELPISFWEGELLRVGPDVYRCAPGSVDYTLLAHIFAEQPRLSHSEADAADALAAARELILGFGGTTVDALWYDEAASSAAAEDFLHRRRWERADMDAENLIAVGFDLTQYGQVYRSRTLLLRRAGPDEAWEYADQDKAPAYPRPA